MILRLTVALLAAAFVTNARAADEPKWLKDARARESKPTDARELKSKDGWFSAKVPAKVARSIENVEGSYTVELDIGADVPVYCEVVPASFDLAAMLDSTLAITLKEVEDKQGKVETRELEILDAGAIGDVPFMRTQWVYLVNDGKEKRLGSIKQFTLERNGHGVYCAHVDLGYTKTFDAIARAFAATLDTAANKPAPYYKEIVVASFSGRNVGVSVMTLTRDAQGVIEAVESSSMLFPDGEGDATSQDSYHKEFINSDGSMINAVHAISDDGKLTTNVRLNPNEGKWLVEGEFQGKDISQPLKAEAQPGTWLRHVLELRALLASEKPIGATHTIPMWVEIDPSRLIELNTRIVSKIDAKTYSAVFELAQMNFDAKIDLTGSMTEGTMKVGPVSIGMKRIYRNGSF